MTSSDPPDDPKRPAAPAQTGRVPLNGLPLNLRRRLDEGLPLEVVQNLVADIDRAIRPYAIAHKFPRGFGARVVVFGTEPDSAETIAQLSTDVAEVITTTKDVRNLYMPYPLAHGSIVATVRMIWDDLREWPNDAAGEHTSCIRLTTILDGEYGLLVGDQHADNPATPIRHASRIARDDLASMHFHGAALPPSTSHEISRLLETVALPELGKVGLSAGEARLQEHILGNRGPHPSVGLGADYKSVFAVLTRAQEEFGRRVLRSILGDYLRSLVGAPIGAQSGLKPSTVAERLATGLRIEDGALFTHRLARLLSSLETSVICIKCAKPAYVDWFRDRFRFRHSALRGEKPSIHASASILPELRLVQLPDAEAASAPS